MEREQRKHKCILPLTTLDFGRYVINGPLEKGRGDMMENNVLVVRNEDYGMCNVRRLQHLTKRTKQIKSNDG